jgi:hypothetical protein
VNVNRHLRGGLCSAPASLLLTIACELLKWQFPVLALSEKLTLLAAYFRTTSSVPALLIVRR